VPLSEKIKGTFFLARQGLRDSEETLIDKAPTTTILRPHTTGIVNFNNGAVVGYTNVIENAKLYQKGGQVDASVHNGITDDPDINLLRLQEGLCSDSEYSTFLPETSITRILPQNTGTAIKIFREATEKEEPGFYSTAGFTEADAREAEKQEKLVLANIWKMTADIQAMGKPVKE
jgi:hypothetical protein